MLDMRRETAKLARELKTVREQKIRKLKAQITSGRYQIRNKDVARCLFPGR